MADVPPMQFGPLEQSQCLQLVRLALAEDLGSGGDITSRALVPESLESQALLVARQLGVVAGLEAARTVFHEVDPTLRWEPRCHDGSPVTPGVALARCLGRTRSLLAAERVALNFLQHLSGVASYVSQFVQAIAGLPCRIYDTRKTTPGWRILEKYAVRAGGGHNHRVGLYDAVLIKDNHLVAWRAQSSGGTLQHAVRTARRGAAQGTVVQVEVDSLTQLEEALRAEPDIVLLDNMALDQLRQSVQLRDRAAPRVLLEASGGITLHSVRQVAETGMDRVSIGAITHSAPALDIALDFAEPRP